MDKEKEAYAKRIGTRLSEIRKQRGKKQIDVCRKTSMHPNHLSLIKTGKTLPSIIELITLCKEYDVELSDIYICNRRKDLIKEFYKRIGYITDKELDSMLLNLKNRENEMKEKLKQKS